MKGEIENPHSGGIYGHKYYGMLRQEVTWLMTVNTYHKGDIDTYINALLDDGALTQDEFDTCKQLAIKLFGIIDNSLQLILEKGDEINRNAGFEI